MKKVPDPGRRALTDDLEPIVRTRAPSIDGAQPAAVQHQAERADGLPRLSLTSILERGVERVQRAVARRTSEAQDASAVHAAAAEGISSAGSPLPHLDQIQRSFGHHDVSHVQAHVGGAAADGAQAMGAQAFATGHHVAFAGAPSLHLAAHEAAHVVQQRGGVQLAGGVGAVGDTYEQHADAVADKVVRGESAEALLNQHARGGGGPGIQMRRLPTNTGDMLTDPANRANPGANYTANAAGTRRLIELAEAELTPAQRTQVDTATLAGQSQAQFDALPEPDRLTRRVEAIRSVRPDLTLGDPNLIDTGPRIGTADAANLSALCARANAIFDAIASGHDTDLDQVFGAANRAAARAKYAAGKTWMNNLLTSNHIVTDRSGYNREVGLGGLTGFRRQISLAPGAIDSPNNPEAIVTMIHESVHAGNSDVRDKGYIGTQVFTQLPEDVKLTNAAHFEVIPRRILGAANNYAGQTFTPAGAVGPGGATTAPLTAMQTAVREASERIRTAWTMGLNLHTQYDTLYKDQAQWSVPRGGGSFRDGLPYWSKVERMTIHLKTGVDPASADPARRPISQIDMALSEGVTRKFSQCMRAIGGVPNDDATASTYLRAHASAAEITAGQATAAGHRDLWIRVALRAVGSITGPEDRDLRVVHELFTLSTSFGTLLQRRDLSGFPA